MSGVKMSTYYPEQDEQRMDIIGSNGNDGEHYAEVARPMTAAYFMSRAIDIMTQRGETYDAPGGERSMAAAVVCFNAKTGHNLTEAEGWLLMQDLKDVRQWQSKYFHQDSAEDCVAYAALKAEALANDAKKRDPSI
jgi:hypothetical protein